MSQTATCDPRSAQQLDEVPNCCGLVRGEDQAGHCCLRHCFEKLERDGFTAGDIAVWAGYVNRNRADGTRVRRLLGLIESNPDRPPGTSPNFRTTLPYTDAVKLALAMGLDPVDLDL